MLILNSSLVYPFPGLSTLNIRVFIAQTVLTVGFLAACLPRDSQAEVQSIFAFPSFLFCAFCLNLVPKAQANNRWALSFGKIIFEFPHKNLQKRWSRQNARQQLDDFIKIQQRIKVSTVSKNLIRRESDHGSSLPFALSFFFAHAQCVYTSRMRTSLSWRHFGNLSTTWVLVPKSITSNSISSF